MGVLIIKGLHMATTEASRSIGDYSHAENGWTTE